MKRLLLAFLTILATSLTPVSVRAQIPGFVRPGLVVTYSGTVDNLTGTNKHSSQQITVNTVTSNTVIGTTVVTTYLSGPATPGGNNVVTDGSITVRWTCTENQACIVNPPQLGAIAQFWVNPGGSISCPPQAVTSNPNCKYDLQTPCPREVVISNVTCLDTTGPAANPSAPPADQVPTYVLLLAFDTTDLVQYSDQKFQPQGTLSGNVGQLIYTFQSMLPPQRDEVSDFNGDGKADILWRNNNGDVLLWLSNPGSTVVFSVQDLHGVSLDWHIQQLGDFNGDGKADILWRNDNGDVVLWLSNPGSAVSFSVQDLHGVTADWHIQPIGTP